MKRLRRLSLFFIFTSLIGLLVLSALIYHTMTRAVDTCGATDATPANFSASIDTTPYLMDTYEDVEFPSADGLTLRAFYVPAVPAPEDSTNAPTVIIVHGINACRRDAFSLLPAGVLHQAGFNALVLDLRNMGESEDDNGHMGMGSKEYQDVIGAVDYLINERGATAGEIGVYGYSMGGATALIAGGFDPRIGAVWADSAYADIDILIDDLLSEVKLSLLKTPILFMGGLLFGDDVRRYAPLDSVATFADRPVYLVFGTADRLVRGDNIDQLEATLIVSTVPYTLWITDSAHVETPLDYPAEFETRLIDFFSDALIGSE
ncbi:MAG: alpha/beta fold hydrolase [Aggregatilineales bacterium]